MYLIFDTETTGLPKKWKAPITDSGNWPRCVQIAWQLHDEMGRLIENEEFLICPDGFDIPYDAEQVHGISTELAQEKGISLQEMLQKFNQVLAKTKFVVGQNLGFDLKIMGAEFYRLKLETPLNRLPVLDTCTEVTAKLCGLPGGRGGKFKLPTLSELHQHLFQKRFSEAHNASADVEATARCFFELVRLRTFSTEELRCLPDYLNKFSKTNVGPIPSIGLKHENLKKSSEKIRKRMREILPEETISEEELQENIEVLEETEFAHLHNHSQYSILQSTISVKNLVAAAAENQMPAVALTDHANMMGAFHFVNEIDAHNKSLVLKRKVAEDEEKSFHLKEIKGIIGCEFFVCENRLDKSRKDHGYQMVLLAKNKKGYHNLAKMSSLAYSEGFYYVPRIDKEIIEKYKQDIIVLSGNLYGEISNKLLNIGENQAEEALLWWKKTFQDDFYLEIMRHGQEDEDRVNEALVRFSKKHKVKLVATNNTYYRKQEDANAHDILLCVKDGEKQATPIGRGRGYRYGLPNQEYYFKSSEEMKSLFNDLPEAIATIAEIVDKIESFTLTRDVLLPKFTIPTEFVDPKDEVDGTNHGENAFLKHLTYQGAAKRYGELDQEIKDRIDFELSVIENTGYPGYFLIVEDFIREARKMGVSVGPGRGSAAGSVVAFCLRITNIDPIKYDLLFERFLNPDRVSMPDIDIDFDDEGRSKVLDYVIQKYGSNQVAQIITYGTMAAKSAIRDTARVLDLPLNEADRIAKLIPEMSKLNKIFALDDKGIRAKFRNEDVEKIMELRTLAEGESLEAETINMARILEGSVRNTGIHACGVIITPGDITNYVPVGLAKDSDLFVTQFDNSVVEAAGLLKMDFLGLKTLTLIKDTVAIVKGRHDILLDPENFPLDDKSTYELFQRGDTIGIFQYESVGMQKHMKELKPTVFGDLIAMNALYRPGPMEYIPNFIARKHGKEEIAYDLPAMEEYLKETYGITVYQEQVMLLSQSLADFTKGEADVLRKAMGKKLIPVLSKMKPKFIEQASAKGHDPVKLEKVWKDWEAFASYAFNKSHSTCYAWIGYQTAYLKAHCPAEYMAAVLSNNMNDIKKVTFFMEECKRMGLTVLGPDINESYANFSVNKENAVRFGMAAIKGVGANAVHAIVEERKKNGPFRSVFDLAKRIDLRSANKKVFENLAAAGGFDGFFGVHRAQYLHDSGDGISFLEKVIKYAVRYQENKNSAQVSLFGEASEVQIPEPEIPPCEEWGTMEKLKREKEVVGIYISGHPLDDFKYEMNHFCNCSLKDFSDLEKNINKEMSFGGVISEVNHLTGKNGRGWAKFTLEDYDENHQFMIFKEDYLKFRHFLVPNSFVYLKIFVKEGWINRETNKKSEPRIQFQSFKQLQDVMDSYAKKLTIQMDISGVGEEEIENLHKIFKTHRGTHLLNFVIYEPKEEIKVHLMSKRQKVNICPELLDSLKDMNIHYRVN